jgi:hypothetical protein
MSLQRDPAGLRRAGNIDRRAFLTGASGSPTSRRAIVSIAEHDIFATTGLRSHVNQPIRVDANFDSAASLIPMDVDAPSYSFGCPRDFRP